MLGDGDHLMVAEAPGMLGHETPLVVDADPGGVQFGCQPPSSQYQGNRVVVSVEPHVAPAAGFGEEDFFGLVGIGRQGEETRPLEFKPVDRALVQTGMDPHVAGHVSPGDSLAVQVFHVDELPPGPEVGLQVQDRTLHQPLLVRLPGPRWQRAELVMIGEREKYWIEGHLGAPTRQNHRLEVVVHDGARRSPEEGERLGVASQPAPGGRAGGNQPTVCGKRRPRSASGCTQGP